MEYSKHPFKSKDFFENGWSIYRQVEGGEKLIAIVGAETMADELLRVLNGGLALGAQEKEDFKSLMDYTGDDGERESFMEFVRENSPEHEFDLLDAAEDEDAVIWQQLCGRPDNTHAYARVWRLQRFLNNKPNSPLVEKECDECKALIPQVEGGSLQNKFHEVECSLFDETKE